MVTLKRLANFEFIYSLSLIVKKSSMILAVTFAEKLQMNMKSGEEMRYDLVD